MSAPVPRDGSSREQAVAAEPISLRLYIAGAGPNSALAEANLRTLLAARPAASVLLEVVDCFREPLRALADGVIVTPMLLKLSPEPRASIIGSLSDRAGVAAALGLPAPAEAAHG